MVNIFLVVLAACGQRPTKPLVLTEQVGELPVQFTSPNCQICPVFPSRTTFIPLIFYFRRLYGVAIPFFGEGV
jgi:hypothetical protein